MQPVQSCLSSPGVFSLLCRASGTAGSRTSISPDPIGQTSPAPRNGALGDSLHTQHHLGCSQEEA